MADIQRPPLPPSLWAETAIAAPATPPLAGDCDVDIAVVGAGFAGLRAALVLAEAGKRVAVLDAAEPGWGASGRNGGQVNPMLTATPEDAEKHLGPDFGERLCRLSLASADDVFDLVERHEIACDAVRVGWIRAAHAPVAEREIEQQVAVWNRLGGNLEILEGPALERLTGSAYYRRAVFHPRGGSVQPLSYARGLARAAIDAGAAIHGGSPVGSLERVGERWRLTTGGGRVTADWALLCTNGYSDRLLAGLAKTIIPLVPLQMATEPLSENVRRSVLAEGHTLSDTRRTIYYCRQDRDGRLLFGCIGRDENDRESPHFTNIVDSAKKVFPQIGDVGWTHRWGGKIAVTPEHMPHLHEPAPGLLAGLGFNGRGVAMATVMGRLLAERVLGAAAEDLPIPITALRGVPFQGFYRPAMGAAIAWLKFRDSWDRRAG